MVVKFLDWAGEVRHFKKQLAILLGLDKGALRPDIVDLFDIIDSLHAAETKEEQDTIQDKIQAWRKSL